jgi:hypothetical protein
MAETTDIKVTPTITERAERVALTVFASARDARGKLHQQAMAALAAVDKLAAISIDRAESFTLGLLRRETKADVTPIAQDAAA